MGKKYRRRYYRKKGKWSSNIKSISARLSGSVGSDFNIYEDLCVNPEQNNQTVSQIFTVKNITVSFDIEEDENKTMWLNNLTCYIMFIPQGYYPGYDTPFKHPEWIMAMKYFGNPAREDNYIRSPMSIKTRLSRKLNTGDKIIFLITGIGNSYDNSDLAVHGVVRWWTKAN